MSVYINKAVPSDRRYLRQIATAAFSLHTWDSDTRIGIISSATESNKTVCNLPFENQLFGYIRYSTENPEININLLPNTCNFHRKCRFIFSLHVSENAQNVHFREAQFQVFPGRHAPGPPSVLAPLMLDTVFAGLTLICFRVACYYQGVILSIILRISRTKKDVSFLSRKGCAFPIVQRYKFLRTADMRSA